MAGCVVDTFALHSYKWQPRKAQYLYKILFVRLYFNKWLLFTQPSFPTPHTGSKLISPLDRVANFEGNSLCHALKRFKMLTTYITFYLSYSFSAAIPRNLTASLYNEMLLIMVNEILFHYISRVSWENLSYVFLARSDANRAVQPQKMSRGFIFWILEVLSTWRKQRRCSAAVPLFWHMQNAGFLITRLIWYQWIPNSLITEWLRWLMF